MVISRPPCLEISESFLLCKKNFQINVYLKYFIGGVSASYFFWASMPNFTTEFYSMTVTLLT